MAQSQGNEFQVVLKALGYLRTHWWLFLLEAAIVYGIALYQYYQTPPRYESRGAVLIDNSRRQLYQNYMLSDRSASVHKQNVAHLLTSQEVFDRFRAQITDLFNSEGRPAHLRQFFPGGNALPAGSFRRWLSLNWDKTSDIYNLACNGGTAEAAHDLCVAFMNTVQKYYPEIGQREAMMKREFLSRQIASLTRQIAERELNLVNFQKASPEFISFLLLDVEGRGRNKLQSELKTIDDGLLTNRATKALLLNVPQAKRGERTSLGPTIAALTVQLSDLQYQLRLTEQSDSPGRLERIARLRVEIDSAESQLAKLNDEEVEGYMKTPLTSEDLRRRMSELELEFRVTQIRRNRVNSQIEELNEREAKFSQKRLEYDRLNTELRHRRKLLNNLYNKEQETELELSAGNAEIFRLREPSRDSDRVAPLLGRSMSGALSLSVLGVLITMVLLMALLPRIDSEAEVNRLNLPVIGKIPLMRGQTSAGHEEIPSFALEYLKIMNYRILRETKDVKCPVIIITSPHAREGKSTVTNCLTMSAQMPGKKVLLIDGDLLTSRPNRFFGVQEDQTPGLCSVIKEERVPETSTLVVSTMFEGLKFMPRGERLDMSEAKNFQKPVEDLLAKLRTEFDIIFIDTPPLFATNLANQWAGFADLIVIVTRMFVTRPKDITEAIATCKIFSRAPVGIALNCVQLTGPYRRASNYYFSKRKTRPDELAA